MKSPFQKILALSGPKSAGEDGRPEWRARARRRLSGAPVAAEMFPRGFHATSVGTHASFGRARLLLHRLNNLESSRCMMRCRVLAAAAGRRCKVPGEIVALIKLFIAFIPRILMSPQDLNITWPLSNPVGGTGLMAACR